MFSPLTEPHTAKLCFSVIFENFLEKSQRTSLFNQKSDYLRKVLWNTQKVFFLNMFEKGKILRNISICLNNFLEQTSKRGQILTKTVFLHKVSHIQLNYFFLLFCCIFREIQRELRFLVKKVTFSETSTEILREFVFLNMFERGKFWGKFEFF